MDRRAFLSRSALLSSALASGTLSAGCGGAMLRPELGELETRELMGRLERGLSAVRNAPSGDMSRDMPWLLRPDLHEHVLRLTLEALVVADVTRSIPDGTPVPHVLAASLAPVLPSIQRAAHTHHLLLSRMPQAARRNLDRRMRDRPELAMDVAGWIDAQAAALGVPHANRARLRHAALNTGTRILRQSANAVIDDCVEKADRAVARGGGALVGERARSTAALVDALWQQADAGGSGGSGGSGALVSASGRSPAPRSSAQGSPAERQATLVPPRFASPGEMANPTEPIEWSDRWARPGDEELQMGAIMLPFALITCGLMLVIGIVVLIAGAAQNASWDGRTRENLLRVR